jgi:hypothetical protein
VWPYPFRQIHQASQQPDRDLFIHGVAMHPRSDDPLMIEIQRFHGRAYRFRDPGDLAKPEFNAKTAAALQKEQIELRTAVPGVVACPRACPG